jgi:hypothetical protein
MTTELAKFLKKKHDHSGAASPIDWDDRRDKYIKAVELLYDEIRALLAEPIKQKIVSAQTRPKNLTENYIGTYMIDDLILTIGGEQVRFSPQGRNVVGASGRVDVVGERAEAMLVLQSDSSWKVVVARQPGPHMASLNQASLAEVLKLVMQD